MPARVEPGIKQFRVKTKPFYIRTPGSENSTGNLKVKQMIILPVIKPMVAKLTTVFSEYNLSV